MEASIPQHFRPVVHTDKWVLESRESPQGKRCRCCVLSLEAKLVSTKVVVRARESDRATRTTDLTAYIFLYPHYSLSPGLRLSFPI